MENTTNNASYDKSDYRSLMQSNLPDSLASVDKMNFDSAEDAAIFFAGELDHVKAQSYDVLYPEFTALSTFPISHEVDPGAETITFYSYDKTGMAKIINDYATDLPRVDIKGLPHTSPVRSIGASYGYSIQDMRASRMAGKSLDARKAETAKYVIEQKANRIAWMGDKEYGLQGVLSKDNSVPLYVIKEGAKGSTKWQDKTEDEILADISGMMKQMSRTTKKVEVPDTLMLAADAYIDLQNRRIPNTDTTILSYLEKNLKGIKIMSCAELDQDSTMTNPYASENPEDGQGVALLFKNSSRKFTIEMPLPYTQYPVQVDGLDSSVPCEARSGGAIIYYPMSLLIAPGIC